MVKRICEMCGKEFNSNSKTAKFCCRNCYDTFRKTHGSTKDIICPICGKVFHQARSGQKFCSNNCKSKSQETKKECTCDNCGTLFKRKISDLKNPTNHFCSKKCKIEYLGWSNEEIRILKSNFGDKSYKEISKLLPSGKSWKAIKSKARTLGLTESRKWSESELDILLGNYSVKPMSEILDMLPNRSVYAILGIARKYGLKSYFYNNHIYSSTEDEYIRSNYLTKTNEEMAIYLNRSPGGIAQHMLVLDLHRPTEIAGYENLVNYVRCKLASWKNEVRKSMNYTCSVTGQKSNIVVHHIRGFNLLFSETISLLDFPVLEDFSLYSQDQLDDFMDCFLDIQESYGSYTCVTESIHKEFHQKYGYGNNTEKQWKEFVNNYKKQSA